MDVLADQLAQARAQGAVFSVLRRVRPWGLSFSGARPLTAHVLIEGGGWLQEPGREPVRLGERDTVLMTSGAPYAVLSDPGVSPEPIADARLRGTEQAPGDASLILCGAYVLDGSFAASLLQALPRAVIVTAADQEPAHAAAIALLADQIKRDQPGQQALLDRLLDVNLVFALRSWWTRAGTEAPGWYRALAEPGLRRVLEQVHADPAGLWSVQAMAGVAGMSRAAFSARFRQVTGESPGSYVTGVRMRHAEDALVRSDATLAQVAAAVGYRNEYAFATAFRRHHGLSPGKWRATARSDPREDHASH